MKRRTFLQLGLGATAAGLLSAGTISCANQVDATQISIEQIEIPIPNLPTDVDGFRIVLMSDFHIHPQADLSLVRSAIDIANGLNPNLVALVGDFVLRNSDGIYTLAPLLARLQASDGIYASLGNHDHAQGAQVVEQALKDVGIPVFRNAGTVIGDDLFYLAGMDDAWYQRNDLAKTLSQKPTNLPTILMMHEPDVADEVAPPGQVALMLSGHSHGGQVRLPLVGATVLPRLGKKYDMGLYEVTKMWLYTTRGIGTSGLSIRLNCRPEVTLLTLRRA